MKFIVFRTKTKSNDDVNEIPPVPQAVWDDEAPRNDWWDSETGNWTLTFDTMDELQAFIDDSDDAIILRRERSSEKWGIPEHHTLEIYDGYRE